MNNTRRLYTDLAWLWPLWGDATTEYAQYCQYLTGLIQQYARRPVASLLNIGCGGGKNVLNLKQHFAVTGIDLSPVMLAQAQSLNPECTFIQADMRTFDLGQTFDAILMDDAISYMTHLEDFSAAMRAAYNHLKPGGVMITTPDTTCETFQQNATHTTQVSRDGLDLVFIENCYDPDPTDTYYEATILYLIRQQGKLRMETDHWRLGIFPLDTWRRILTETGFAIHETIYHQEDSPYTVFACIKEGS